jgi:hypothetical protein
MYYIQTPKSRTSYNRDFHVSLKLPLATKDIYFAPKNQNPAYSFEGIPSSFITNYEKRIAAAVAANKLRMKLIKTRRKVSKRPLPMYNVFPGAHFTLPLRVENSALPIFDVRIFSHSSFPFLPAHSARCRRKRVGYDDT